MDVKSKQNKVSISSPQGVVNPESQLKNVAALYEKQFLREMVKQMRSTVSESSIIPTSFAEKYYREQLDHQYVEAWGDQGGIGLGKVIYDQLVSRYGEQLGIKVPQNRPKGPIPLGQKELWDARFESKDKSILFSKKNDSNIQNQNLKPELHADKNHHSVLDSASLPRDASDLSLSAGSRLENPWAGKWLGSFELENGLKVAKIQHEGFQSVFVGKFQTPAFEVGKALQEGEFIGALKPESQQLHWKLIKDISE